MKKSKWLCSLTAVAACTFLLPAMGSTQNPITRPFKVHADAVGSAITGEYTEVGIMSLGGTFVNLGWHVSATETMGVLTAANGDQLFWDAPFTATPLGPNQLLIESTIIITGGTGRFENATGSVPVAFIVTVDDQGGMSFSYEGEGTLTY